MDFISNNSNASLSKWVLFPLNWKCLKIEQSLGKKSYRFLVLELVRRLIEPSTTQSVNLINAVSGPK